MKECTECQRIYYDETLNFCLEDGAELVDGPSSGEPATAVLRHRNRRSEAPTQLITETPPTALGASLERNKILLAGAGLVLLLSAAFFAYRYLPTPTAPQIESIAVMPFVNASGDPEMEYLSDGLTDSLISNLSRLPNLSVKARNAVFRYKGQNVQGPVIGKELGVQAILNGRVVPRGNELVVFVELTDPATEKVIWSENYNRSLANLASLQSELAADVSRKLKAKLSAADQTRFSKIDTDNPEALQHYLNGRFQWSKRTPEGIKRSIEYFEKAVALDPRYARAYAGLANAYAIYFEDNRPSSGAFVSKARESAMKALTLDPDLADAHAALGMILTVEYNFAEAEKELRRSIELDPDYPTARHWYSLLLSALGRHEEAIAEIKRALEIEPLSALLTSVYAGVLFDARRYDESMEQTNRLLELDSGSSTAYSTLGSIYALRGEYDKAVEAFVRARELSGDPTGSAPKMRKSYEEGGWRGYLLSGTKDPRTQNFPYTMARLYLVLGDRDEAFAQLNRAYEIRDFGLRRLKVDPRLDGLRDDRRYNELLKKVGFRE